MRKHLFFKRSDAICVKLISLGLAAAAYLSAHTAAAEEALTLQEASQRALKNNPELQVFEWRMKAVEGERQTAALKPGYELGFDTENIFGTGDFSGINRAEYTLALSSVIELGDKRYARMAVTNSHLAVAQIEREAQALELLGQVAQRFIVALGLNEKVVVAMETTRLAEASLQSVKHRVERGAAPAAELLRAQASLAQAQLQQGAFESELASRKMALAALWDGDIKQLKTLTGNLYSFQPIEEFEELYRRVSKSPAIDVFFSETRLRDAELELARSQSSNNLQWSIGVKYNDEINDSALTAGISIPLFAGSRNKGRTQTALAKREMVEYRKQATLRALRTRLFEAWITRKQSATAVTQFKNTVLPLLEKTLTETQSAYKQGRYRYTDLFDAQRELLNARLAMIDAATTALLNQALIEQLTGQSLVTKHSFDNGAQSYE